MGAAKPPETYDEAKDRVMLHRLLNKAGAGRIEGIRMGNRAAYGAIHRSDEALLRSRTSGAEVLVRDGPRLLISLHLGLVSFVTERGFSEQRP